MIAHPLVDQLRFTRSEFMRSVKGVSDEDGRKRLMPMNCLAWNVGHLAWQEQQYFITYADGRVLFPDIAKSFTFGAPASTPSLQEMVISWQAVTEAADPWLDTLTSEMLSQNVISRGKPIAYKYGNLLQRTIYHYWYHTGENMAIRQMLGHDRLGNFVGNIDDKAPYRPES